MAMNPMHRDALLYVLNTGGGATVANFAEDHEPIGFRLWAVIESEGYVEKGENGRIRLTAAGRREVGLDP